MLLHGTDITLRRSEQNSSWGVFIFRMLLFLRKRRHKIVCSFVFFTKRTFKKFLAPVTIHRSPSLIHTLISRAHLWLNYLRALNTPPNMKGLPSRCSESLAECGGSILVRQENPLLRKSNSRILYWTWLGVPRNALQSRLPR